MAVQATIVTSVRYTIITPTLLRETLPRLCRSIEEQTDPSWQHIVMVDTRKRDETMLRSIQHPQRLIIHCERPHKDTGNTCRRAAWEVADGDYLLYIDDDNFFHDPLVFETLRFVTEPVALFPLLFQGEQGPVTPFKIGASDGNQLLVKREIGRWPDLKTNDVDGIFILDLTTNHPYELYEERPLVVYEYARHGQ